jgi:hypothetical protein
MTPAEKVERLQALLERIRANSLRPRPRLVVAGPAPEPPPAEAEAEEELTPRAPTPAPAVEKVAASASSEVAKAAVEDESLDDQEVTIDVELLDEDIVDITDLAPEEEEAADAMAGTEVDIEVEPPSSSRRPKVAPSSMDQALAEAAARVEEEVPLKTPPPESGRQIASFPPGGQLQHPPLPHDLAKDLAGKPSVEQVGQTIDLREAPGPALELAPDRPAAPKPAKAQPDAMEAELEFVPPPAPPAAEKLPPVTPRVAKVSSAPPAARVPSVTPAAKAEPAPAKVEAPPEAPAPAARLTPEVVARPAPPPLVDFVGEAQRFKPQSFVELLDASLGL